MGEPPGEKGGRSPAGPSAGVAAYRQVFEGVALPVLIIESDSWKIVAVNEAALAQYGYSRDEFVGLDALRVRPPEGRSEARRVLSAMPHGFWRTTAVRHQRKDGSVFDADVWSRDTVVDGRPVRICTISDVTERVELQRELQQAQKMEAVGRLAGGVAHDFNNALTSIIGGVDLLRLELNGDPRVTSDLEEIKDAAQRAAALTRSLLAFSRRQVMKVEAVELADAVRDVVPLLVRLMGESVELRVRLAAETGTVHVDRNQLEQVVLNLAVNARDAMPEGGTLTVSTRNLTLVREAESHDVRIPAGDYAELAVADTGFGMDEATRSRVFEPFFTTRSTVEGAGLGLSTSWGIVRQTGGFITVDSEPGRGSTFRVLLPRAAASDEAPGDGASSDVPEGSGA